MFWSEKILNFFSELTIDCPLPKDVKVLHPYQDIQVFNLCKQFYQQYYSDTKQRQLIIGINPGRLGGGLTGIPFTDPDKLETYCNIANTLKKKSELSADFVYRVIVAYGGPKEFFSRFYFSSVSPLGFTKDGKNLNYYDIPELQSKLKPFIIGCLKRQLRFGLNRDKCFVLGEGKNFTYLEKLNAELRIFKQLVPLPHPRFIMQYKRKHVKDYLGRYILELGAIE